MLFFFFYCLAHKATVAHQKVLISIYKIKKKKKKKRKKKEKQIFTEIGNKNIHKKAHLKKS
jgi:hypothetical protein